MILVAGGTGFVGRALLPRLRERFPGRVRVLARREFDALRLRDQGVEAVAGDCVSGRGLDEAMRGVDTLVYLVHTPDRGGDPVASELTAVQNTLLAARKANVRRVVYLGDVAADEESASQYLVARWAVELAVRQSGLEWVVLRAPLIVGRGGTLFELLRRTVDRSLVVPLFRWRRTQVEPVALGDVVEALETVLAEPRGGQPPGGSTYERRIFDICGAERITFGDVVRGYARATGKRRIFVPLPGRGERTTQQIAWTLARLPRRETRRLLQTMHERQVCTDPSRRFPLPRRPLTYRQALEVMLEE